MKRRKSVIFSFMVILCGSMLFFSILFNYQQTPDSMSFIQAIFIPLSDFGQSFSTIYTDLISGLQSVMNFFSDPDLSDIINLFKLFGAPFKAIYYVVKLIFDILDSLNNLVNGA